MINRRDFIKRIGVGVGVASTTTVLNIDKNPNTKPSCNTFSEVNPFGMHRADWEQESIKLYLKTRDNLQGETIGETKGKLQFLPYYLNSLPRTLAHFTMGEELI